MDLQPWPHGLAALAARCERVVHAGAGQDTGAVVWRRLGRGPRLLLLHGGHGNWLHWAPVMPQLGLVAELWVPDLPGYGESNAHPPADLDTLVTRLSQAIDALPSDEEGFLLAGFSFGGLVAACLAARRRDVRALALIGPAGHGGPRRPRGALVPWRGIDPERQAAEWCARMAHNLGVHMLHAPGAIDATALFIHGQACLRTRFRSKAYSRAPLLAPALDSAARPTLVLHGEHDVTLEPRTLLEQLVQGRAERKAFCLAGAGHWAMFEAPDATAAQLVAWLAAAGA